MLIKIYSRWDGSKVVFEREGENLREVVLAAVESGANLSGANLSSVKNDLWDVLFRAPGEVAGLLESLKAGKVNGSVYEGECACLVGTIANVAHCNYQALELIKPNAARPAERWFLAISPGQTPETSSVVKLTVEWIEEFQTLMSRAVSILANEAK